MQKSCKGHQRSNLEWCYIKKFMSPGVLFIWKFRTCLKNSTGLDFAALLMMDNFRATPLDIRIANILSYNWVNKL